MMSLLRIFMKSFILGLSDSGGTQGINSFGICWDGVTIEFPRFIFVTFVIILAIAI